MFWFLSPAVIIHQMSRGQAQLESFPHCDC
jgi:hypothetical protein